MADLSPNTEVVTESPTFAVTTKLPQGTYRYQLVVEDDHGLRSDPVTIDVQVLAPPVAVLTVNPGTSVRTGDPFTLDGSKSTDQNGKIVKYHWTLLTPNRNT
jgi:hypothetical protein